MDKTEERVGKYRCEVVVKNVFAFLTRPIATNLFLVRLRLSGLFDL
jgi:hypothetical protein